MKSNTTWVLLANGSSARVLENRGFGTGLKELGKLAMHAPDKEKFQNPPGVTHDSNGPGRHRMEPHNAPEQKHGPFATEIVNKLSGAAGKSEFDHLVVMASPQMLGALRHAMPANLKSRIVNERDKDLTAIDVRELPSHFDGILKL